MARVKVTPATVVAKLTEWAQNTNRQDELVFYNNEINEQDIKQRAWDLARMIVEFMPDTGDPGNPISSQGFRKIVFVDKL